MPKNRVYYQLRQDTGGGPITTFFPFFFFTNTPFDNVYNVVKKLISTPPIFD